ncbi:hypothetical protein JOC37_002222 [Desulfohalotomaculum tongense]|uniref:DUF951 domain-containing protein n=1 Tax=Desulforadius tongensis TaxID=1216062 RepID=UPI00195BAA56|nr:DUF951 domain-containing protein [Desulforadius tongensis]MBM7855802.1 hypothetical protein [Desulforadius tongensis]
MMRYSVGDIVRMRKSHPCGGDQWEIMRTGVDIRIKCTTCGRVLMLPRPKFEKSLKAIISENSKNNS